MSSSSSSASMKAILVKQPGSADQLYFGQADKPVPKSNELLVKIHCFALNRMDIVQREGRYPLPPEAGPILGVEFAGIVESADGRMSLQGAMGGSVAEHVNLLPILFKRLHIEGSTLRSRSLEYQRRLSEAFSRNVLPHIESGEMFWHIDRVFDWEDIQDAHRLMEAASFTGKIVIRVTDNLSDPE
ncbi:hypothetical protein GGI14_004798 [Coemansia sp. S680]|nr:hypothetical protein GGI14_004798 [Coemansia sp. S680]